MVPRGGARSGAPSSDLGSAPRWCPEVVPRGYLCKETQQNHLGAPPRGTTSGHHLATLPTSSGHQVGAPSRGTTQSSCLQVKAPSGHLVEVPPEKSPANQVRSGHQVGAPSRGASEYFGPARTSQKRFSTTSACPGTSAGSCEDLEKSCDSLAKPLRNPCEAIVEPLQSLTEHVRSPAEPLRSPCGALAKPGDAPAKPLRRPREAMQSPCEAPRCPCEAL